MQARLHDESSDPFMDFASNARYVLYLTITIPSLSDTRVLVWYQTSPRAILDHWVGSKTDIRAPDWCRSLTIGEAVIFSHARSGMAEFFARLALSNDNKDEVRD